MSLTWSREALWLNYLYNRKQKICLKIFLIPVLKGVWGKGGDHKGRLWRTGIQLYIYRQRNVLVFRFYILKLTEDCPPNQIVLHTISSIYYKLNPKQTFRNLPQWVGYQMAVAKPIFEGEDVGSRTALCQEPWVPTGPRTGLRVCVACRSLLLFPLWRV